MPLREKMDRYELENLPISRETREGLTAENINQIGAVARMMYLQDDVYDEQFSELKAFMQNLIIEQRSAFARIESRLTSIEQRLSGVEDEIKRTHKRIEKLQCRINDIETRLNDYYLKLLHHKHSVDNTSISFGIIPKETEQ